MNSESAGTTGKKEAGRPADKRNALTDMVRGLAMKSSDTAGDPPAGTTSVVDIDEARKVTESAARRGIVGQSLNHYSEAVEERLKRFEKETAEARERGEIVFALAPDRVFDRLPADRDQRAFTDESFRSLVASIDRNGQDQPILVRRAAGGDDPESRNQEAGVFEIAAGRRRLAACKVLGIPVLARVKPLSDADMLDIQWRENAEREDISLFERCRWVARLSDELDLSTARLGEILGVAQPTVVEWRKMGRLPAVLVDKLDDPRELGRNDSVRLNAALKSDDRALDRMVEAIVKVSGKGTKRQVAAALAAASSNSQEPVADLRSVVIDDQGRKLLTVSRSGRQALFRWDPAIDERVVREVGRRLAGLVREVERELAPDSKASDNQSAD